MRSFTDREGRDWVARVRCDEGVDYKGRCHLAFVVADEPTGPEFALEDVRWNSERTARRTLETMSVVELRRRLGSALGRSLAVPVS